MVSHRSHSSRNMHLRTDRTGYELSMSRRLGALSSFSLLWCPTVHRWCGRPIWQPWNSTFLCGGRPRVENSPLRLTTWSSIWTQARGQPLSNVVGSHSSSLDLLGEENLFPKTSGSKGLQLYMPLKRVTSDVAVERAHEVALSIEQDQPKFVVSRMRKELRPNKVLIDWSQNNPQKTTVAAYSLRALSTPTVSTPVTWEEVEVPEEWRSGRPPLRE